MKMYILRSLVLYSDKTWTLNTKGENILKVLQKCGNMEDKQASIGFSGRKNNLIKRYKNETVIGHMLRHNKELHRISYKKG